MNKQEKITAIIIAKNEESNLSDCLNSIKWAQEILLVDDYSNDRTVDVAKKHDVRLVKTSVDAKGNYSKLRNLGLVEARGEWVFYIDADERATKELAKELVKIARSSSKKYSSYAIPRKNIILGREMKHGGWWPDYVKRLFRKSKLKGWTGDLHEEPNFEGEMGFIKNAITHLKHDNLSEMVEKTNQWSTVEAKLMLDVKHPKMNIFRFSSAIFREFWLRLVQHKGYKDGAEGTIYSIYQIFSRFVSYAKLWEMQIDSKNVISLPSK